MLLKENKRPSCRGLSSSQRKGSRVSRSGGIFSRTYVTRMKVYWLKRSSGFRQDEACSPNQNCIWRRKRTACTLYHLCEACPLTSERESAEAAHVTSLLTFTPVVVGTAVKKLEPLNSGNYHHTLWVRIAAQLAESSGKKTCMINESCNKGVSQDQTPPAMFDLLGCRDDERGVCEKAVWGGWFNRRL